MNVFVLIPAYNEEKKIGEVIKGLKNQNYSNIVVVDDGSEDNTKFEAEINGAKVIHHLVNRGQGAALKTGINYCLSKGADIIVTFDADGQHSPNDVSKIIKPIIDENFDVVLGSRFLENTTNAPFFRKLFLKCGALLLSKMYKMQLTDSHNGLRALSKKAAEKIKISTNGMEHASEIIEQISKNKLKYKEIPVTIKYTEYSLSHGQKSLAAFKILYKMLFRKLTK